MCPTNSQLSPLLDDGITQEDRKPRRENRLVPRDHALNCRQVELSVLETLKWKRPVSYICAFLEYASPPEMVLLYVFFRLFFFFFFFRIPHILERSFSPGQHACACAVAPSAGRGGGQSFFRNMKQHPPGFSIKKAGTSLEAGE